LSGAGISAGLLFQVKKSDSFSEEKKQKDFYDFGTALVSPARAKVIKVFWLLFLKK
jgi:hypothetical protein